jgi:type II secretory pathway component PulJ
MRTLPIICPPPGYESQRAARAFTLVELIAAMAVLTLIVVSLGQMLSTASSTITGVGQHIDSDSEARLILDRMADDFAGMAKRPDLNFYFHHQTSNGTQAGSGTPAGNDALYFFSSATGYFASSDVNGATAATQNSFSLVGYRINDNIGGQTTGRFQLERLGRGLHWYDTSMASSNGPATQTVYLPMTIFTTASNRGGSSGSYDKVLSDPYNNSSNLNPAPTDVPQWDVIGDQVVRFEFCYLLKDGTLSDIPVSYVGNGLQNNVGATTGPTAGNDSSVGYTSGSRWYDRTGEIGYMCVSGAAGAAVWMPVGLQDTRAVVVAIALLNQRNRGITSAAVLSSLVGALADFTTPTPAPNPTPSSTAPSLMAASWQNTLSAAGFASSIGLAPKAAANIRIYQRYFYLN